MKKKKKLLFYFFHLHNSFHDLGFLETIDKIEAIDTSRHRKEKKNKTKKKKLVDFLPCLG
jgi:hypothetical protein